MISANTGVVLYQLSYPANWELVTLLAQNIFKPDFVSARPKCFHGQIFKN